MSRQLNIWMNGRLVGHWSHERGTEKLHYADEWIGGDAARPLSLSMPLRPSNVPYTGDVVLNFFDNLLPDSTHIRTRLASKFKAESSAAFDMLLALGRDCVGALQLLPPEEVPENVASVDGEVLDEAQVAKVLRATTTGPLGQQRGDDDEDLRLSIAGAQEKTALLFMDDQWYRPAGSTPTTHIMKLPLGLVGNMKADMRTSVENEWLCSKLAAAFGLSVASCDIAQFEDQKVLVVERFDRRWSTDQSWIVRLPQEDFCQATDTPSFRKYQNQGGPGIEKICQILQGSSRREADITHFLKTQIFFWLLAATDGHAKNFSIFHLPGGNYELTPLYDILSAHPIIGIGNNLILPRKAKLAMAPRGTSGVHYNIDRIKRRHWNHTAGLVERGMDAEEIITDLLSKVEPAINAVFAQLPEGFPMEMAESIFQGIRNQAALLNQLE